MDLILRFFAKNGPFFTWLVLVILSILLLCHTNPYHRSVWFGGANIVSGGVHTLSDGISGYFGLRKVNSELLEQMAKIEEENFRLRQELQAKADVDSVLHSNRPYTFVVAHVIDNTITQAENYLILNKGSEDGIAVGMAVADQNGAIGQVSKVGSHFAQVISILNPKFSLSSCIQSSEAAGSVTWEGDSPAYAVLNDVPRNVPFQIGDTVITSGYGGSFPRGIPVGTIIESSPAQDNNFLTFKISLSVYFERIKDVFVIKNNEPCQF